MITINVTIDLEDGEKNLVYRLTTEGPGYATVVQDSNGFGGIFPSRKKALEEVAATVEAVATQLPVC